MAPEQPLSYSTNTISGSNSFTISQLQFCPTFVHSCFGCSQTLKPNGMIGNLLFELVVISRMQREYRTVADGRREMFIFTSTSVVLK